MERMYQPLHSLPYLGNNKCELDKEVIVMNRENKTPNHLIHEKSPYLLQHAYNPVDWYPWSEEAFHKAQAEDKPIFLSIGYSTCHWCHVMERESFEDEEVAKLLNQSYIAIKVDKEERPDVDTIYMSVCTAIHGHGGWPLTILMTPKQVPFYAGTYLPKNNQAGRMGLLELLIHVAKTWREEKDKLILSGDQLVEAINSNTLSRNEEGNREAKATVLGIAIHQYESSFDEEYGGFGNAPKFPSPHNLLFLLRYAHMFHNEKARLMAEVTLRQMYLGGIYDHIGGGFSRYSTDRYWLIPHFEKMLYDNALLTLAYLEAYQATGDLLYRHVAEETLHYISREMQNEEGGFYCAQDADSEGEEGKYYVFTPEETEQVLGKERADRINKHYDITPEGNFEGASIPNLIAGKYVEATSEENEFFSQCKEELYAYRLQRTELHKDDKCLTSWNALMLAAYARAYRLLKDTKYESTIKKADDFIKKYLMDDKGRLFVRYRENESFGMGHIDDYAFLCFAYYELYEATFEDKYLIRSLTLMDDMLEHFWDNNKGGFYFSANDAERLIMRPKETYDGAMPSGNSVALYMLCKLEHISGEPRLKDYRDKQLAFMNQVVEEYPSGYGFALLGYMEIFHPVKKLICLLDKEEDIDKLKRIIDTVYAPDLSIIVKTSVNAKQLDKIIGELQDYQLKDKSQAFYYCENYTCKEPIYTWEELENLLQQH